MAASAGAVAAETVDLRFVEDDAEAWPGWNLQAELAVIERLGQNLFGQQ